VTERVNEIPTDLPWVCVDS